MDGGLEQRTPREAEDKDDNDKEFQVPSWSSITLLVGSLRKGI